METKIFIQSLKKMSTSSLVSKLSKEVEKEKVKCIVDILKLRGQSVEEKYLIAAGYQDNAPAEEMSSESLINSLLEKDDAAIDEALGAILGEKEYAEDYSDITDEQYLQLKNLLKKGAKEPKKKEKIVKEKVVKEKVVKEKKERVTKESPAPGSISEKVLNFMKENPEMSTYKVSKALDIYQSQVDRVKKTYLK